MESNVVSTHDLEAEEAWGRNLPKRRMKRNETLRGGVLRHFEVSI